MGLHRPPPLAVFFDYDGDIAGLPSCALEGLAEVVVVQRRLHCAEQRAAQRDYFRTCVDRWVEGGPTAVTFFGACADPVSVTQATVSAFAWAADCYDDDALAERFERALPCDMYAELIEWANERKASRPAAP